MGKNILVLIPVEETHKRLFEEKAPDADFIYTSLKKVTEEQIRNANIIIGNPPIDIVKGSGCLELLQLQSAGAGDYIKENALPSGAVLTNASGAYGLAISEHMLGLVLELFKNLHLYRDNQHEPKWSYMGKVKSIYNSTALIVGAGDIGCEFARRLKDLGAYTIGVRRKDSSKPEYFDEMHLMDKLENLLPGADIVALSLPETKYTIKIMNKKTLGLMKQDAVIINVGRGSAIDTEDLCDALENGRLLGAGLDVTDPEPLPKDHRLWGLKNAIITPHVSGGFSLKETHERLVRISADNIDAVINGKKIINIVDRSAGY